MTISYGYEIFPILRVLRARVSKRHFGESRRHFTTGFSENIVVAGTGYQI